MMIIPFEKKYRFIAVLLLSVLSGCASVNIDEVLKKTNDESSQFTKGQVVLAKTVQERQVLNQRAQDLLSKNLTQSEAVQLALINSPAVQALIAQNWSEAASAAQAGRMSNPYFVFERMVASPEVEFSRWFVFGLLDLITLPQRKDVADKRIEQAQIRLTSEIIDQVTLVRQSWVRAVAAKETLKYAEQVFSSAEVAAELAKRMEAVGNFNKITRARQQAFYADSATQLANTKQVAVVRQEELVRALGLSQSQASELKLPNRLPALPKTPLGTEWVAEKAGVERLDIRLAQATLEAAAKAQGLNLITSFTDIELAINRGTRFNSSTGESVPRQGYQIAIRLPIFDWGNMSRDAMNAQTLAAFNRLEAVTRNASSNLRQTYSAYRTSYDVSQHYRNEVVPVRKAIAEESQLRYNGMIIGVFELLADARDQVSTVIGAIDAQQQFWLADAALQSSLIGRPTSLQVLSNGASAVMASPAGH
ncbi:TolC family protein [Polynucleobacter brandtiae]|uniref:Outer membrane efflux protein n=1 Tax=Polynucleobacter brandtiae TaxID=1938816 RepID=A0A2M8VIL6_9BURK|nr:TolC family protein [Polynucleobacter brandtiae]PJI76682.1 outer membrane efflux protein [Polynucleobacter brandtiae]